MSFHLAVNVNLNISVRTFLWGRHLIQAYQTTDSVHVLISGSVEYEIVCAILFLSRPYMYIIDAVSVSLYFKLV